MSFEWYCRSKVLHHFVVTQQGMFRSIDVPLSRNLSGSIAAKNWIAPRTLLLAALSYPWESQQ